MANKNKKIFSVCGDVSATNILIAACDSGTGEICFQKKYPGQDIKDFTQEVIRDFCSNLSDIESIVLSPAGAINEGRCKMTNARFTLDAMEISDSAHAPVALINDFEAIGYAIAAHEAGKERIKLVGLTHLYSPMGMRRKSIYYGKKEPKANLGIGGAGTGFGEARAFYNIKTGRYEPKASEGGHKFLQIDPRKKDEEYIFEYLSKNYYSGKMPHIEAVLSGRGIEHVFRALVSKYGGSDKYKLKKGEDKAAQIAEAAKRYPASLFGETMDFFWKVYGRALHDIAVHENARGGIYIAGGIIRKNIFKKGKSKDSRVINPLVENFDLGPTHASWVNHSPLYAIIDEEVGLKGAKYVALTPDIFSEKAYKRQIT